MKLAHPRCSTATTDFLASLISVPPSGTPFSSSTCSLRFWPSSLASAAPTSEILDYCEPSDEHSLSRHAQTSIVDPKRF